MRKLLLLLPALTLLCGFGIASNRMALVPGAQAARQQAIALCRAGTQSRPVAEALDCIVAADRDFALALNLRNSRLLDDYTSQVRLLARDIDSGTLKPAEATARFQILQAAFFKAANQEFAARNREAQAFARQSGPNLAVHEDAQADLE